MARPIEATPILYDKDAKRFLKDIEKTNKKLENSTYRKKVKTHLGYCEQLYLKFSRKGHPIAGVGCCLENSQSRKRCIGSTPIPSAM